MRHIPPFRLPRKLRAPRRAATATLLALGLLAAGWAPPAAAAFAPPGGADMARLELSADRTSYGPGTPARIAARVSIAPGWHVNSNQPTFDWLIPTELRFDLPAGWTTPAVTYPPHEMQTFAFEEQPLAVYDGEVVLVAELMVPEHVAQDVVELTGSLRYQACNDTQCLPPTDALARVTLAIGAPGEETDAALFVAAQAGSGAPGTPSSGAADPAPAAGGLGLATILLLGLVGGLILNAMPCVLPILSLKVFGLVHSASQGRRAVVVGGLATAAGILLSFWALAGAAVAAKAAGAAVGWGVQFQNPLFVTFLLVVIVLFCLNLWGLFEIPLPGAIARLGGSGPREGVPGHLVSGFFATLMATPCSAPFLGTAVGFGLGQAAGVIFAVFTSIGLGMALPYLLLAAFPGSARLLPKPGAWMETLRRVMGFLLAGAAIWLLYVLAAQVSPERRAWIELSMIVLALFVWLRHRATRPRPEPGMAGGRLGRRAALAGAAAAVVAALVLAASPGAVAVAGEAEVAELIDWVPFDRTAAEALTEEGRLVFVDVTADWCFTCKVNERLVLETPRVAEAFERHQVVAMKADWTNRNDDITAFLADHGRYGIPFYLLYRPTDEPHVFGELITQEELVSTVASAAGRQSV